VTAATATPAARQGGEVGADVLARAKAGDRQAFTEVVRHYDHRLRALAYRLLGDLAAMDDALQEAYVKAYRAMPGFRGDAAVGTWLYRITYHCCLDLLRREGRHRAAVSLEAVEEAAGDPAAEPGRRVAERAELARALDALPPDQRVAVLLVDTEGFDYAAAGEVLGVPAGTVASRLSRARAALRAALAGGEQER
jgi:RNA polymerase sigma-70 factor (ECF subfamily)